MTQNTQLQPREGQLSFTVSFLTEHLCAMKSSCRQLFIPHTVREKGMFLSQVEIFLNPDELEYLFYLGKTFQHEATKNSNHD